MASNEDYTGTHKVVLPADYMNSVEAVCDLYEDRIDEAGMSLDNIPGLRLSWSQRLFRFGVFAAVLWLLPMIWSFLR
ncbi:MAG: hypothetical protein ACR2QV_12070 [Gammaproteobacteria bacterium]